MKNFDEARASRLDRTPDELTFVIGGETLVVRGAGVRPEVWTTYWDVIVPGNTTGLTNTEQLQMMDRHMEAILEPESAELWQEARKSANPPITLADIFEVIQHIWEVQTSRPTGAPSDSSERRVETSTSSTDA